MWGSLLIQLYIFFYPCSLWRSIKYFPSPTTLIYLFYSFCVALFARPAHEHICYFFLSLKFNLSFFNFRINKSKTNRTSHKHPKCHLEPLPPYCQVWITKPLFKWMYKTAQNQFFIFKVGHQNGLIFSDEKAIEPLLCAHAFLKF